MKLVIVEKPSVAMSIANVIGATDKKNGYMEGNGYVVSWCVGHLVELADPSAYDERYGKWNREDLPILPEQWKYKVNVSTRAQYKVITELMKRADVTSLVEATDAGREGELIFRLVYDQAHCTKPFERLWISSMEDEAIRDGFNNLKPGSQYEDLYEAALCREHADWIVGINATRLFSTMYGATLNIGRVMTPTLALTVQREADISSFTPEDYYVVQLNADGCILSGKKIKALEEAKKVVIACRQAGKAVVTKADSKEKKENPPALYDLTSLQRDANKLIGFTAQQTLDYTQSLYEKKLVTYPRTDSRFLTEDMEVTVPELIENIGNKMNFCPSRNINTAQVINGKKVTDHHAIMPTRMIGSADLEALPIGERGVLALISIRMLEAVSEPCTYNEVDLEAECAGYKFSAKYKNIVNPGWREVSSFKNDKNKKEGSSDNSGFVIASEFREGSNIVVGDGMVCVKKGRTSPPKHFTEDTLLSAMEKAGAEDTPEEAERKGLGTPATRAGIIEKLVRVGFIERTGDRKTKYLLPTEKGKALIGIVPDVIKSASMTADWEQKLVDVEKKNMESDEFMSEIEQLIGGMVEDYEKVPGADFSKYARTMPYKKKWKGAR